jgi:hypothetical protein
LADSWLGPFPEKQQLKALGDEALLSPHLSWQTACELGFRGNLGEWERLMGAPTKR